MSSIADNIETVTRRIQKATMDAGRPEKSVHLLAVSKTRPVEDIRAAYAESQTAFGENYLQEALDKIDALRDLADIEWHFIGPIQSNKTRAIANAFHWVHGVDRVKIARRLGEQREASLPPLNVCIQVNINEEDTKSGCSPSETTDIAAEIIRHPSLNLRGLMAIPDPKQSEQALHRSFTRLAELLKELRERFSDKAALDTLSMGMSSDMEVAISAGATWVRVGTAIFGARPPKTTNTESA